MKETIHRTRTSLTADSNDRRLHGRGVPSRPLQALQGAPDKQGDGDTNIEHGSLGGFGSWSRVRI
ncbi:hypothetical protein HPP92_022867 [Vanilla planifolia]|uniref:Uncharacterized protein n=1 Tax=Vanilla planifolia TaxID=51239 RepID=A0A835PU21_VANPL|nr:hypothetical protein HPP92_022867 [Vanilla planifolia]